MRAAVNVAPFVKRRNCNRVCRAGRGRVEYCLPVLQREKAMPKFFRTIYGQVVVGLVLGILVGVFYPDFAVTLKPLGDGFIKLIKMIIAPIVFCVVVSGICHAGDLKKVGRVGGKAIVYFEALTTLALIVGIVLAYVFEPGVG